MSEGIDDVAKANQVKGQLKALLRQDKIKLWERPYTNIESGVSTIAPRIIKGYADRLQEDVGLVKNVLEVIRLAALAKRSTTDENSSSLKPPARISSATSPTVPRKSAPIVKPGGGIRGRFNTGNLLKSFKKKPEQKGFVNESFFMAKKEAEAAEQEDVLYFDQMTDEQQAKFDAEQEEKIRSGLIDPPKETKSKLDENRKSLGLSMTMYDSDEEEAAKEAGEKCWRRVDDGVLLVVDDGSVAGWSVDDYTIADVSPMSEDLKKEKKDWKRSMTMSLKSGTKRLAASIKHRPPRVSTGEVVVGKDGELVASKMLMTAEQRVAVMHMVRSGEMSVEEAMEAVQAQEVKLKKAGFRQRTESKINPLGRLIMTMSKYSKIDLPPPRRMAIMKQVQEGVLSIEAAVEHVESYQLVKAAKAPPPRPSRAPQRPAPVRPQAAAPQRTSSTGDGPPRPIAPSRPVAKTRPPTTSATTETAETPTTPTPTTISTPTSITTPTTSTTATITLPYDNHDETTTDTQPPPTTATTTTPTTTPPTTTTTTAPPTTTTTTTPPTPTTTATTIAETTPTDIVNTNDGGDVPITTTTTPPPPTIPPTTTPSITSTTTTATKTPTTTPTTTITTPTTTPTTTATPTTTPTTTIPPPTTTTTTTPPPTPTPTPKLKPITTTTTTATPTPTTTTTTTTTTTATTATPSTTTTKPTPTTTTVAPTTTSIPTTTTSIPTTTTTQPSKTGGMTDEERQRRYDEMMAPVVTVDTGKSKIFQALNPNKLWKDTGEKQVVVMSADTLAGSRGLNAVGGFSNDVDVADEDMENAVAGSNEWISEFRKSYHEAEFEELSDSSEEEEDNYQSDEEQDNAIAMMLEKRRREREAEEAERAAALAEKFRVQNSEEEKKLLKEREEFEAIKKKERALQDAEKEKLYKEATERLGTELTFDFAFG